jgi:hypothetical protein
LSAPPEQTAAAAASGPAEPGGWAAAIEAGRTVLLSSLFLGGLLAMLTWPVGGVEPTAGLDPSWVAGLYLAGERGLDAGTQIVFTYGPLGFLGLPNVFGIWMGRIAFFFYVLVQIAFCSGLLWASRRAFGLAIGLVLTFIAASVPTADPILLAATVLCAATLTGEWSLRARLAVALGIGALSGIEMLGSLRAGPTLLAMGFATMLGLPDRRRTFPAFFAAAVLAFGLFWFVTGQALANLGDYLVNTAEVVSGYSAAMVFYGPPGPWWEAPVIVAGLVAVAALCLAAVWRLDNMRRIGLVLMTAAVTFLMFKHAVVRESAGSISVFVAAAFGIGLALVPYVHRAVAIAAVALLLATTYVADSDHLEISFDPQARIENFGSQLADMTVPGQADEVQERGRETMRATYKLSPAELALLRSGSVHVAPWEAGVAWAYELDWDPLPVFQQYSAYTKGLDELNAEKLESSTAPNLVLWQNTTIFDPSSVNYPGAIDARWPAFESPAQMVQMFCRYRAVRWSEEWAVLRRAPDRCGRARPLGSVETGNAESVRMPRTRRDEALLARVDGLEVGGVEKLRTMLYHAQNRHVLFSTSGWNIVGDTAADGLLLRVPRWADYPGKFSLDSGSPTVGFERVGGFMTGVDDSTKLTIHFYAVPLDEPAIEGGTAP